jgi:pentatricopeptide repeat protein
MNESLLRAVKREDLGTVVRICRQLSLEGCQPNMETYEHVLSVLAVNGLLEECWAMMADMEHSGFVPNVVTYNYLLEASSILHCWFGLLTLFSGCGEYP